MRVATLGTLMLGVLLLAGCQSARVGVGQPRALLYKNVTVPYTAKRDRGPNAGTGLVIPPNLSSATTRFYSIGINLWGVGPPTPGLTPLSVGWGNASNEAALTKGKLKEVIYGDARELEILGVFNMVEITVFGLEIDEPNS